MTDRKELELLIRTTLKGGGDVEKITKTIRDLEAAIERQADSAKKGENAYDGLKAALDGLRIAQEQLDARTRAFQSFEKLAGQIDKSNESVARATKRYEAYTASMKKLEAAGKTLTDEQIKEQNALQAALTRAGNLLDSRQKKYQELGDALRAVGVDTSNLAAESSRLEQATLQGARALDKGKAELTAYSDTVAKARAETAELARQQALLARLQDGNETDARVGRLQREAAATAELARQQALLGRLQEGNETDARSKRDQQRELLERLQAGNETDARARILQRNDEAARDTGLKQVAADAEKAAAGYSTLARASNDLRPKVVSLRQAVDAINDPTKAVTGNLGELERAVSGLSQKVATIKGPVDDYAGTLRELTVVQKGLAAQADLFDRYNKDTAALRASRAEMVQARAQVAQYAAAVRQGGDAGQAFVKPLAEAEARLKAASKAMRDQVSATRESRDALRGVGVNTSQLVNEQQRLVNSAQAATSAVKGLAQAHEKNGEAVKKSNAGFSLFRDEGRTTLSLVQRIKGEVLALAAAYVGVQGAISIAGGALKAFNEKQALESRLSLAVGNDPTRIGKEIQYLKEQADRLGISFDDAGKGYSKFAVSAVKAGQSIKNTRFIFEGIGEASRVLNLTGPETEGIFNAISQSFSKGKIQAEELRGQIGERLPGAFAFAQEALKDVFPDLDKALEKGQVGAENMVLIVESLRRAVADRLPSAVQQLGAEQARFNNQVEAFKLLVAESGFADAYLRLLKDISNFLKGDEGKEFAKDLSNAFSTIADGIRFVIRNFDEFKLTLTAVAAYLATGWTVAVVGAFAKATAGVAVLGTALSRLATLIPFIGAAILAWNIGEYLFDKFEVVRKAVAYVVTSVQQMWAVIQYGAQYVFSEMPRWAENGFKRVLNAATSFSRDLLKILRAGAVALNQQDLVGVIDKALDSLTFKYNTTVSSKGQEIADAFKADIKAINAFGDRLVASGKAVADGSDNRFARQGRDSVTSAFDKPTREPQGPTEGEIKKRENEIEAIRNALDQLDARTDKLQSDNLAAQLDAIDLQYNKLEDRIKDLRKIAPKEAAAFAQQFQQAIINLQAQTISNFNKKMADEQATLQSRLDQIEAAAGKKQVDNLEARLNAVRSRFADFERDLAAQRDKVVANNGDTTVIDALQKRTEVAKTETLNAERQKFFYDELARRQQQITDAVKARQDFIQAIKDQEEAGAITKVAAEQKIRDEIARTQPLINDLVSAGLLFADTIGVALDPARVEAFRAALAKAQGGGAAQQPQGPFGQFLDKTATTLAGQGIDSLISKMQELNVKTADWGDVFDAVGKTILETIGQILIEIGKQIIKEQILLAIQMARLAFGGGPVSAGNGLPSGLIPSGAVMHSGGVVGPVASRTRAVPSSWFANAPRYHSGGITGLAPDEYPAILQKNEEVLKASDPRNVMNMARSGAAGGSGPSSMRFVLVDDRDKVPEAMAGAEGEKVTMMHIQRNIASLRQQLR